MGAEVFVRRPSPGIEPNLFIGFIVVCVVLLCAIAASAHEIGKTLVQASLGDRGYQIDVVVDPDALLPTLEAYGQQAVSRDLPRAQQE